MAGGLGSESRLGSEGGWGWPGQRASSVPKPRDSEWLVSWPWASARTSVSGVSALHVHHPPGPELTQLPHQAGMSRCSGSPRGSPPGFLVTKELTVLFALEARCHLVLLSCPSICLQCPSLSSELSDTCRYSATSSQSQPLKSFG